MENVESLKPVESEESNVEVFQLNETDTMFVDILFSDRIEHISDANIDQALMEVFCASSGTLFKIINSLHTIQQKSKNPINQQKLKPIIAFLYKQSLAFAKAGETIADKIQANGFDLDSEEDLISDENFNEIIDLLNSVNVDLPDELK